MMPIGRLALPGVAASPLEVVQIIGGFGIRHYRPSRPDGSQEVGMERVRGQGPLDAVDRVGRGKPSCGQSGESDVNRNFGRIGSIGRIGPNRSDIGPTI